MKRIALIPIDNRPVCYTLPMEIAAVDEDIELLLPNRCLLGDLTRVADFEAILEWLQGLRELDSIILSLDTIAYGGLVSSRRGCESFEDIAARIYKLSDILKSKNCDVLAFSSVMRISNNNINEEEKEYWADYGTKLFEYSFLLHKYEVTNDMVVLQSKIEVEKSIPQDILEDYICTRERNFNINKLYLKLYEDGVLNTLVYSKDDCAQYGINVKEANLLAQEAIRQNLDVMVKTGADEIPLSLLSRALMKGRTFSVAPVFANPDSVDKISKYEDVSVLTSVISQLELAGVDVVKPENADIMLYVNNFKNHQGELVMDVFEEGNFKDVDGLDSAYFIADILNANGADNSFIGKFFENKLDLGMFFGYAGWNTTGNTLGSVICIAITKYMAKKYNESAFKKLMLVRFLDDWAYQANVRKQAKDISLIPDIDLVKEKMAAYELILKDKLSISPKTIDYRFPWGRYFEIEVLVNL